jgi:hypothetical protein
VCSENQHSGVISKFVRSSRKSADVLFSRLLKNPARDSVLKGRGFQPRRKCCKINSGFSRCGGALRHRKSFRSLLARCGKTPKTSGDRGRAAL